jgi:acetyl-CoA C-acetyltransferase
MNSNRPPRVAVVAAQRTPFARSNTAYLELGNKDLLAHCLRTLVERCAIAGEQLGEVVGGAVTSHSRDWNLTREALLSTPLAATTPAVTLQQACGTSLKAAIDLGARIAVGEIDSGIACGVDTTSDAPLVFSERFSKRLLGLSRARSAGQRLAAFKGFSLGELKPVPPSASEPRTGLSMGEHCELMAREWNIDREAQDRYALDSHRKAAAAYDEGFYDDLLTPCEGLVRDNNIRADASLEKLASLKPAFSRDGKGTLTAGNSTPLTDGAAAVLLASEEWAAAHDLPVLAYLGATRTAAVDFVAGEGLLMAPTVAVSELLAHTGLSLQDFDLYEIHEAFAAQVLCTLEAWRSQSYCRQRLGREAALGDIDPSRINVKGSSLAVGHPFAATGARIVGTLAHLLEQRGSGRGLISICTAGGMGVAAILER